MGRRVPTRSISAITASKSQDATPIRQQGWVMAAPSHATWTNAVRSSSHNCRPQAVARSTGYAGTAGRGREGTRRTLDSV